ncbi:hypothetical protein CHUAL_007448 [Chamberlinius hualienensis]
MFGQIWLICTFGSLLYLCSTVSTDPCDKSDIQISGDSCTASDFPDDNSNCTLQCTTTFNSEEYTLGGVYWIYYGYDPTSNVTIIENVDDSNKTNTTTATLTLYDYYSGIYSCQFNYSLNEKKGDWCSVSKEYNISQAKGIDQDGSCKTSSECLYLNATCTDTCQCGTCNITDGSINACLCESQPNATCHVTSECVTENYFCTNFKCKCGGVEKTTNDSKIICLLGVKPGDHCDYVEECREFDKHTECIDSVCVCNSEYSDGLDDNGHCIKPWELTDADIAGIAVAGVVALGIIAIIIRCIAEACCCRDKKDVEADDD